MLQESPDFQKRTIPEKAIFTKLAQEFESQTNYLFMNHEELHLMTDIGTKELWKDFLGLQEVISFIKGQMAFLAQIAQRKTFQGLVEQALSGNQAAAKQVQELSGIMNQQDQNRTIVLHRVPRPQEVTE